MRTALVLLCLAPAALWPLAGGGPVWPTRRAVRRRSGRSPLAGWRQARGRTSRERLDDATADLLGVLAAPLRAGTTPLAALLATQGAVPPDEPLRPVVDGLVRAGGDGSSLADVWFDHGARLDSAALRFVGSAWSVSETTGAPLAEALACAEGVLRARRRAADRLRATVAGPRASMTVLALLPVSGPVVGLACGVGPRALYLSSSLGGLSLLVGAAWAALAWAWASRIVRSAS